VLVAVAAGMIDGFAACQLSVPVLASGSTPLAAARRYCWIALAQPMNAQSVQLLGRHRCESRRRRHANSHQEAVSLLHCLPFNIVIPWGIVHA